jgi:predicted phosphodiesterase
VRVCVISDIHGNAAALEAVLDEIAAEAPDAIWCLGDIVGYGPRPNECCQVASQRADVCLSGNHDLGVLGEIDLSDFHGDAAASALWTREVLGATERAFLESLEPLGIPPGGGAELYHGSPRDPIWEYVLTGEAARAALEDTKAPVVLVGHSHVALAVSLADGQVRGGLAPGGTDVDLTVARWLLNPGSVGQPRDGDPRAAYLTLDLERRFAVFRRVAYPIEKTQAEIRERGLPESLAARLATGG